MIVVAIASDYVHTWLSLLHQVKGWGRAIVATARPSRVASAEEEDGYSMENSRLYR